MPSLFDDIDPRHDQPVTLLGDELYESRDERRVHRVMPLW